MIDCRSFLELVQWTKRKKTPYETMSSIKIKIKIIRQYYIDFRTYVLYNNLRTKQSLRGFISRDATTHWRVDGGSLFAESYSSDYIETLAESDGKEVFVYAYYYRPYRRACTGCNFLWSWICAWTARFQGKKI